jgi:hypothetical protein
VIEAAGFTGNWNLRPTVGERTFRKMETSHSLPVGIALIAFSDVPGDADSTPADLVTQPDISSQ